MRTFTIVSFAILGAIAVAIAIGLVSGGTAIALDPPDGKIIVSDPMKDGNVVLVIECVIPADDKAKPPVKAKKTTINASVFILATDNAKQKRDKIYAAIDGANEDLCFLPFKVTPFVPENEIHLINFFGSLTVARLISDNTNETITFTCTTAVVGSGKASFEGTPQGGTATVSVGPVDATTTTTAKTASQVNQDIVVELINLGVDAIFSGGRVVITENLANVPFGVGTTDSGLTASMDLDCTPPVGGTTELLVGDSDAPSESAGSSGDSALPIAAAAGGLLIALAGGGLYVRRRLVS